MKTPEEWLTELNYPPTQLIPKMRLYFDIEAIQKDAFLAGQLDGLKMGKETALKTIGEVFSKPAERSESV